MKRLVLAGAALAALCLPAHAAWRCESGTIFVNVTINQESMVVGNGIDEKTYPIVSNPNPNVTMAKEYPAYFMFTHNHPTFTITDLQTGEYVHFNKCKEIQ